MTNGRQVTPQRFIIKCFLLARDKWVEEAGDKTMRYKGFRKFTEWLMNKYKEDPRNAPEEILQTLQSVVNGRDIKNYSVEDLETKLNLDTFARSFRIANGADVSGNGDHRARELTLLYVCNTDTRSLIPIEALMCTMFAERGATVTKEESRQGPFHTRVCTSFQRLLFLDMVRVLTKLSLKSRYNAGAPKRRLSTGTRSSTAATPSVADMTVENVIVRSIKSITRANAQRIGFVVQTVVDAWNKVAVACGADSIESLILPYLRFRPAAVPCLQVIGNRVDGYAPKRFCIHLLDEQGKPLHPTSVNAEAMGSAPDHSNVIDTALRRITKLFLQDLFSMVTTDSLYTAEKGSTWDPIQRYASPSPTEYAPYFKDYIPERDVLKVLESAVTTSLPREPRDASAASPPSVPANLPVKNIRKEAIKESRLVSQARQMADSDVEQAEQEVRDGTKHLLRMYNCSFKDINDMDDQHGGGEVAGIMGNTQLILCDPPYNIRRQRAAQNSEYDVFTDDDMKNLVNVIASLLRDGGHGLIFCSWQQWPAWYKLIRQHGRNQAGDIGTFSTSHVPLITMNKPKLMNSFPGMRMALYNGTEFVMHFYKNGLPTLMAQQARVNYSHFHYVPCKYPPFKNIIDNVPKLVPGEQVRIDKGLVGSSRRTRGARRQTVALRAEQKSVMLLMELIARFSQPGDLVVDLCAGTFSTGVAALSMAEHRVFVGSELDPVCFSWATKQAYAKIAEVIANQRNNLAVNRTVRSAAKKLVAYRNLKKLEANVWRAPQGFETYQCLPSHTLGLVAARLHDPSVLAQYRDLPFGTWSPEAKQSLEVCGLEDLLTVDQAAYGVFMAPSTIKHKKAGNGLFASRAFNSGDVVCHYYGTLIYEDFNSKAIGTKTYGEGILGVNLQQFKVYAFQLRIRNNAEFPNIAELSDGKLAVFVVPAPFCAGRFINDYRYQNDDEDKGLDEGLRRVANVRYSQSPDVASSRNQVNRYSLIQVTASRNINPGEELFADYGDGYFDEQACKDRRTLEQQEQQQQQQQLTDSDVESSSAL